MCNASSSWSQHVILVDSIDRPILIIGPWSYNPGGGGGGGTDPDYNNTVFYSTPL